MLEYIFYVYDQVSTISSSDSSPTKNESSFELTTRLVQAVMEEAFHQLNNVDLSSCPVYTDTEV